jgi:hypothetical protein
MTSRSDEYERTPPPTRLADRVQLRTAFSTEKGTVTKFVTQLEYWYNGDWVEVIRYDHDQNAKGGHDITEEGLHRDVYRDGEKVDVVQVTPAISADNGFNAAEDDLKEHAQEYIERFERWHDIRNGSSL